MHIRKQKPNRNSHRGNDPYYQSSEWKRKVDLVWERDGNLCQQCLDEGKLHPLTRRTRNIDIQGTVDHIKSRRFDGGSDDLTNLRLIGSNHHASKAAKDKKTRDIPTDFMGIDEDEYYKNFKNKKQ